MRCSARCWETQKLLLEIYKKYGGSQDAVRRDININVMGINHFTWLDRAQCLGTDLFPLYERFIREYYDTGRVKGRGLLAEGAYKGRQCVKMDLFRRFGIIAAGGDRHLAEFMPGTEYLNRPRP